MRNRFVVVAVATFLSSSAVFGQQVQQQQVVDHFQDALVQCILAHKDQQFVEGDMGDFVRRVGRVDYFNHDVAAVGVACAKAISAKLAAVRSVKN